MLLKSESKRERILLTLFPAAVLLAGYAFLFAMPLQRDMTDLEKELAKAKLSSVSVTSAYQSSSTLRSEKETVNRMEHWLTDAERKSQELCEGWRGSQSRLETLQQITRVMNENDLSILSQGAEASVESSGYQMELLKMMNQHVPSHPIEVWNVEVQGAYAQVVSFLAGIQQLDATVVPVALSMTPGESGKFNWSIVLAI